MEGVALGKETHMIRDLIHAVRQMTKAPGFTAVVVLSLALGIGANVAVICWLRQIVFQPIRGAGNQQEIAVLASNQGGGGVSLPDLRDFGDLEGVFAGTAATMFTPVLFELDRQQEWLQAEIVSASFFELLEVRPIHGRTFRPGDDRKPGGDRLLVISENLWRRRFAASPDVVGRVVTVNRHSFEIIGVVPRTFRGSQSLMAMDLWAPLSMISEVRNQSRNFLTNRGARGWHNFVRLKSGTSLVAAQQAVTACGGRLAAAYPADNRGITHRVLPLSECPWGAQKIMGPALQLLLAVSLGVLLLVAANLTNLLLARALGRQKELAIRFAGGATRMRLVRQLLTESLLMAAMGAFLGQLLAQGLINSLPRLLPETIVARTWLEFHLDPLSRISSLGLMLAAGLIFGLIPACLASRVDASLALRQSGSYSHTSRFHTRLRNGLVVSEVALAVMLLGSAGLCFKGLREARRIDSGFQSDGVLLAGLRIGMNGYNEETGKLFYRRAQERLASAPGVEEAALASWFPLGLGGCKGMNVEVDGYQRAFGENPTYEYARVSPRYFAAMRIPLLEGRDFSEADDARAVRVAIVNEHFARRFWPGQNPIGRRFKTGQTVRTVIGLAKAGKYNRLNEDAWPFFYIPYQQGVPDLDLELCIRLRGDPEAFVPQLRKTLIDLDPGVELLQVLPLAEHSQLVLVPHTMAARLLTVLGMVGLGLAALGVYAVMAYGVSRRMQEFGIRMALGADAGHIHRMILRQGLYLSGLGAAAGLLLTALLSRLLQGFLYGISTFDPFICGVVAVIMASVALLASWLPARRATRANPLRALQGA